jgi:hypothetical protein
MRLKRQSQGVLVSISGQLLYAYDTMTDRHATELTVAQPELFFHKHGVAFVSEVSNKWQNQDHLRNQDPLRIPF